MSEVINVDFENRKIVSVDISSVPPVQSKTPAVETMRDLKTPEDSTVDELVDSAIEALVARYYAEQGGDELEITDINVTVSERMSMLDRANQQLAEYEAMRIINSPSPEAS